MEWYLSILSLTFSALGIILAIVGLIMGLQVFKLEKKLNILDKHKEILIEHLVLYGDKEMIRGRKVLDLIKKQYNIQDDYEALLRYYRYEKEDK